MSLQGRLAGVALNMQNGFGRGAVMVSRLAKGDSIARERS